MTKEVVVVNECGRIFRIEAHPYDEYFVMSFFIESPGLKACLNNVTLTVDFINFFRKMADSWKGWTGEVIYDGEVKLVAVSDSFGHITLSITLEADGWTAKSSFRIEAGRLDSLATEIDNISNYS